MRIAAVWLPPIAMEGMPATSAGGDVIHLEADIHATEGNPNGFAKDEFVPYLKIRYAIDAGRRRHGDPRGRADADGRRATACTTARASRCPTAGEYRLTYHIEPPSAGGLGRHSDPVTGVAPWWEPFEVAFDWDYPGPPPCTGRPIRRRRGKSRSPAGNFLLTWQGRAVRLGMSTLPASSLSRRPGLGWRRSVGPRPD